MALKVGATEVRKMAKVLDPEYDHRKGKGSLDDDAKAELEAIAEEAVTLAWEMYEKKAKFNVVGQLYYAPGGGWIDPEDARASKVSLGMYGTEKQAEDAAKSLVFSTATNESFRAWVLPVHHGTPASYYHARKEARQEAEIAGKLPRERELQRRIEFHEANPGQPSETSVFEG